MSATRSVYGLVRRTTTHGRRLPGHSRVSPRRLSNALSSSSVPFPSTAAQDDPTNTDCGASDSVHSSSFQILKDRVSHDTLKALTLLEAMTPVQERVTALLPDLVRPWNTDGAILPPDRKSPEIHTSVHRDLLVRAKTGTGKTFAYLIPAIESRLNYVEHHAKLAATNARLAYRRRSAGPLILAPTRELAIQIASDAQKLTTHQSDFEVQLLVGGASRERQLKDWTGSSRDLVVATPGRLRDLLTNEPELRRGFKGCPMLVLDEADTLLSMGFRDDIDAIASFLPRPPVRQTLLLSATMPRAVRQLASWILSPNYTFIDAAPLVSDLSPGRDDEHTPDTRLAAPCDDELTTHDHISQFRTLCPTASDQLPTLLKLLAHDQLSHGSRSKVMVFCPTAQTTELFSTLLRLLAKDVLPDDTTEIVTMHSKMKQSDRDRTWISFRKAGKFQDGKPTILVSSDLSARGVDYPGVTRVIQIGIPSKEAVYLHRIERMARGDSFVPVRGEEHDRPTVRTDLLLLPWEARYMDWQLTSLPIKPLPISALDGQLTALSPRSSVLTTDFLKSAVAEIRRRIDPADVRRTAASLLGYYLPLAPPLRMHPNDILAGVSSWASECFDVSIPAITRFPRKFTEAYEQSVHAKRTKGLFVDGLRIAGASPLGKAKSGNRSVWEGANVRRKRPKRWH